VQDLRDQVTCIIAERVFLDGHPPIWTQTQFEERLVSTTGRLAMASREVGDLVAKILEPRFAVAQRIAGGTPRLWAASVADIREHAAYLMPRNFLGLIPWERLRRYPKYSELMRERLSSLREGGSMAETEALHEFLPHWKRFTAWVAAGMASEREAVEAGAHSEESPRRGSAKAKAPLPQARRVAPTVNLDAAEWAIQPGRLSVAIEQYRWALEELRFTIFSRQSDSGNGITSEQVQRLWTEVQASDRSQT
jgi:hypothetical protein